MHHCICTSIYTLSMRFGCVRLSVRVILWTCTSGSTCPRIRQTDRTYCAHTHTQTKHTQHTTHHSQHTRTLHARARARAHAHATSAGTQLDWATWLQFLQGAQGSLYLTREKPKSQWIQGPATSSAFVRIMRGSCNIYSLLTHLPFRKACF